MFKVKNINDLETVYSILRETNPTKQIDIVFNWNTKEYTVNLTNKPYKSDPEVPLDLNIEVVYGDSVTGDTPIVLRNPQTGDIFIKSICEITNSNESWVEYPEFKMFDQSIRLEKMYSLCDYEVWSDLGWTRIEKVIRHKTDKQLYRVYTKTGIVDVTEDHSLLGVYYNYITPSELQIGEPLLQSFPKGDDLAGVKTLESNRVFFSSKTEAMEHYLEYKRRGEHVYVSCINDVYYLSRLQTNNNNNNNDRFYENRVYKITDLGPSEDYVYDLETECGRFMAGVGDLIVKNTDSCFLRFRYNRDDFQRNRVDTFRLATVCGNKLTDDIFKRPPIELEFEKVFQPFVLLTKKRYIAQKYEDTRDPFKLKCLDAKGIALTRRDYCKMVKMCYKEIIDTIMKTTKDSVDESIAVFKRYIQKIDRYDIPIDDLVVSAMLAKSYKTKPVHVLLAERLKERKEEVQIGDRIPYIFIEDNSFPRKQKSELGEDPKYAQEHGLKFNRSCYLEQLAKPILGFYKIVLKDNPSVLDDILVYVNSHLEKYGSKGLKPSDFKIEE